MLGQVSRTFQEVQRPLLTPDECLRMPGPRKDAEGHIEAAGDMVVYVAGYPAIYGKQPLYLRDAAREVPTIAIAAAAREALRLADTLEAMLASLREALPQRPRLHPALAALYRLPVQVDALSFAQKCDRIIRLKPKELLTLGSSGTRTRSPNSSSATWERLASLR